MTTIALAPRLTALRPVARALQHRVTHAPHDPITALTRRVDLAPYRAILAYPWWTLIREAILDTRSYDGGLAAGIQLLGHTETYRDVLAPSELESHVITLGLFVLEMLDRLDDWQGYLATWDLLRTQTLCGLTYEPSAAAHSATSSMPPRTSSPRRKSMNGWRRSPSGHARQRSVGDHHVGSTSRG